MTKEDAINKLKESASVHSPEAILCCIAGHRADNGKDYYTYGEFLESLDSQEGYVWEKLTKSIVDYQIKLSLKSKK